MSVAQAITGGLTVAKAVANGISSSKAAETKKSSSNQDNFIDLLISQITHQDPLEPMNNETMVTQMTQMQTLEKIEKLNENIESLMVYQNLMNSIDLIDKNVMVYDEAAKTDIIGKVEGIKIQNSLPGVVVGSKFYDITKVKAIAK